MFVQFVPLFGFWKGIRTLYLGLSGRSSFKDWQVDPFLSEVVGKQVLVVPANH